MLSALRSLGGCRWHLGAAAMIALSACSRDAADTNSGGSDSAGASRGAAGSPLAGTYTAADFARLRWLEGSWRGALPDGGFFHERYHFVDDSTIVMHGFADSTFTIATDSSRITLRDGTIASEGGARSVATALDSTSVSFSPERPGSNHFTWTRQSEDRWTASLRSSGQAPRMTVYRLERVKR